MGPKKDAVWDKFHEPYVPDGSKAAKAVCRNYSAVVSSHICSLYQTKRIIRIICIIQPTFQKFIKHSSIDVTLMSDDSPTLAHVFALSKKIDLNMVEEKVVTSRFSWTTVHLITS